MENNTEDTPLLNHGKFNWEKLFRKHKLLLLIIICVGIILFLLCIIIAFVDLAVKKYKFCASADNASSVVYSRSESVSLLKIITDFTCYKPTVNAQLNGEASLSIYEAQCKDLHSSEFHIHRKSLVYENVTQSMVVLSEDFSENYFLKGSIELNINTTFNSSEIYVCLFVNYKAFRDFTNLDKDWKMYIKNATCRHTSQKQFTTTFEVKSPNYVFVAIAATTVLNTLQFGYSGTGYSYNIPSLDNLTELCSLQSGKPSGSFCSFTIARDYIGDDLCLLASNGLNADGSYYYSTITLTFPYINRHIGAGVAFTAACIIVTVLVIIVIAIIAIRVRK